MIFNIMTYLMLIVALVCACGTPIAALTRKRRNQWFCVILFNLYLSQLFMYYPGADVSPYAYVHTMLNQIKFAGMTLSAIFSIVIILFIVIVIFIIHRLRSRDTLYMMTFIIVPCLIGMAISGDIGSELDSLMKLLTPFLVCLFLVSCDSQLLYQRVTKLIYAVNSMLIVQVIVCKIFYGQFAAYNYYYEMAEEYFGYYNHPHSFTGLLAVLSIYNVYAINKKEHRAFNAALLVINVLLMWVSGVRTYVVALLVGLVVIGLYSLRSSNMRYLRKYVYAGIFVAAIIGQRIYSSFGAQRVTADSSSGRLLRWAMDLSYYRNSFSPFEWILGRGTDAVNDINQSLFGVSINSLNMLIDLLLNYGVVGLILIVTAYILLFKHMYSQNEAGFFWGTIAFFVATSMINSIISYVTIMTMIMLILYVMGNKCNSNSQLSTSIKIDSIGR